MCKTKELAVSKMDKLIASMDRLSAALEASNAKALNPVNIRVVASDGVRAEFMPDETVTRAKRRLS